MTCPALLRGTSWLLLCLTFLLTVGARTVTAEIIRVPAGGDLQAAIDAAKAGDVIELQAQAVFRKQLVLPVKAGVGVVTIRTEGTLPERRVTPEDARSLATIASPIGAAAISCDGCSNYLLTVLRFEPNPGGFGDVISLQRASNITLDRILLEVPEGQQQKNGILGNARGAFTLTRSHISGIVRDGQESHGFVAWDGAGPYTLRDNFIEAASIPIMFGGADPSASTEIPSDITIEGNHLFKRLAWKSATTIAPVVKNLLELKTAKRVKVYRNLFENNWSGGQAGTAIVFTVRNQQGTAPFSTIEDIDFAHNIVRGVEGGAVMLLGADELNPSGKMTRVSVRQNLFEVSGYFLQASGEIGEVTFDHNTSVRHTGNMLGLYAAKIWIAGEVEPRMSNYSIEKFTFTNNIVSWGAYGPHGDDCQSGIGCLTKHTRGYTFLNNAIGMTADPDPAAGMEPRAPLPQSLPSSQFWSTISELRAQLGPDQRLLATSSLKGKAIDGSDPGWSGSDVPPTLPPTPPPPPPLEQDTVPPAISALTVTRSGSSSNYKVTTTADDDRSVARVDVYVDNALKNILSAPTSGTTTYLSAVKIVTPGAHVVRVVAYDAAGNQAASEKTIKR